MEPLSLSYVVRIVMARRPTALGIFVGAIVLTVGALIFIPKTYKADASIVVDLNGTDLLTGSAVPSQVMSNRVATEADVIESHETALKVIDKLNLTDSADVRERFESATHGNGSIRDWYAEELRKHLKVKPTKGTRAIHIIFGDEDAKLAADIANAFAEAYIEITIQLKVDPARRQAGWLHSQTEVLRLALERAQQQLSDYQREHNIAGADARLDVENARLASISDELVKAQASSVGAQSKLRQMEQARSRNQLDQLPDVLGSPLLMNLKVDLERAHAKLADAAEHYGPKNPAYLSSAAAVSSLQARIAIEISNANGALHQAADTAQRQIVEFQDELEQQKARILQLKQQRDTVDVLAKDVETAQQAYAANVKRAGDMSLNGQLNDRDAAVFNSAYVPLRQAILKLVLIGLAGPLLGAALSVGTVVLLERLDCRVRSRFDLVSTSGLHVIGELPAF